MPLDTALGSIFQNDPDLRLAGTEVYLDPAGTRETGIISHGHMPPHLNGTSAGFDVARRSR